MMSVMKMFKEAWFLGVQKIFEDECLRGLFDCDEAWLSRQAGLCYIFEERFVHALRSLDHLDHRTLGALFICRNIFSFVVVRPRLCSSPHLSSPFLTTLQTSFRSIVAMRCSLANRLGAGNGDSNKVATTASWGSTPSYGSPRLQCTSPLHSSPPSPDDIDRPHKSPLLSSPPGDI